MSARRESEHKRFVEVRAEHRLNGTLRPLMFREEDDLFQVIDEVLDVREAPALKAGGQGMRYTCRVLDRELYLFHDDVFWFVEDPGKSANATVKEDEPAMCGRYFLATDEDKEDMREMIAELNRRYSGKPELAQMARGEIFPTMTVPVIANSRTRKPSFFLMKWGFTHFQNGGVIINARSETAMEKPLFRQSMQERRCLIPATNYFEWARNGKTSTKYAIRAEERGLTYMAGIYRIEEQSRPPVFSILTCDAAPNLAFIHPRMPLLIPASDKDEWLLPDANLPALMRDAQSRVRCSAEAVGAPPTNGALC